MTRSGRRTLYLIGAVVLVVALVGGRWLAVETVERAWDRTFRGGDALVQARLLARLLQTLVIAFGAAWATGNLLIVYRSIGSVQMPHRLGDLEIVEAVSHRVLLGITALAGVALGVLLSLGTGDWWRHALLASAPPHFGIPDQTLGHDAGYYIAVLPWRAALQHRALVLTLGVLGTVILLYALIGSLRVRRARVRASDYARAHCGFLLACLALVIAWGAALDPAEVIGGLHGPVDQAALSIRVPGSAFVAAVAIVTAIISLIWGFRDRPNLIVAGWAALLLSLAAAYAIIPGVVRASASGGGDSAALASRRADLERAAFGLTAVNEASPPAFATGEAAVRAIPLWDAARVAAAAGVPAAAVALRPARGPDEAPTWLIAPLTSSAGLRVAVEADTGLAIRDLPLAAREALLFAPGAHGTLVLTPDSTASVARASGIPISGTWRRFALAWTVQAWDMLRAESDNHVFLYRRDVVERLDHLAPFARFGTPTPVMNDGALWWVSWGYVSSEAWPLARPIAWRDGAVRYLRPGLIGAVRVATGETHVWLAPGHDSLTAAWGRHFTPLIEPADRVPADIVTQLGYPRDAFDLAVAQIVRASTDSSGRVPATGWTQRPSHPFELVGPPPALPGGLWTGVALESGGLAPRTFEALCAGMMTPAGPVLHLWRPAAAPGTARRLPGELVGSFLVRPGEPRIWPAAGSLITVQAEFAEPAGVTPSPTPRIAEVWVSLEGRNGRGLTARAALHGGEAAVTDTTIGARWLRARRLATQADSALSAGDLEVFGRLWRALLRELAPAPRPR